MRFTFLCCALALLAPAPAIAAEDITQPTLVTLKLDNVPPKQVFDDLAKQAGTEFLAQPKNFWEAKPGAPISVAYDKQPFWLAMKDLCAKSDVALKYATDTPEPRIILARDKQEWTQYPSVASGPFLVSLIGLQRQSTVDMRKPADVQRTFFAKFSIFCEPRVRLLRGSLYAKLDSATDDKSNSLIPKDPPDENLAFITSWVYNLEAKLEYPQANAGTKIPSLKASAKFVAQTKSETIEFPDPAAPASKNIARTVAGRKVTLNQLRHAPEEWEAVVTFSRDGLAPEQWAAALFPGNALKLVDAEGRFIVAKGFGLGGKGEESRFVFKFEKDPPKGSKIGKPAKLVWEIPTETRELPLTFEFKDVTLP